MENEEEKEVENEEEKEEGDEEEEEEQKEEEQRVAYCILMTCLIQEFKPKKNCLV